MEVLLRSREEDLKNLKMENKELRRVITGLHCDLVGGEGEEEGKDVLGGEKERDEGKVSSPWDGARGGLRVNGAGVSGSDSSDGGEESTEEEKVANVDVAGVVNGGVNGGIPTAGLNEVVVAFDWERRRLQQENAALVEVAAKLEEELGTVLGLMEQMFLAAQGQRKDGNIQSDLTLALQGSHPMPPCVC
eukprot:TRINITY_DN17587_c0_g2_i1.p1 TRINITY_DN17587_c0_g2~~TRINITY_DN17587_c0_g2_i1.p1  ORF type:complete len:190 (-),score=68.25 TRINITY_DN17587_c0_g2_i1:168-737(-)